MCKLPLEYESLTWIGDTHKLLYRQFVNIASLIRHVLVEVLARVVEPCCVGAYHSGNLANIVQVPRFAIQPQGLTENGAD